MSSAEISKEFLTSLQSERNKIVLPRTNHYTAEVVNKILDKVKERYSFSSLEEAKAAIAVLFQQGGTANRCDGNMTIKIFDKTVKLSEIRKIVTEQGSKKGERKLARTLATDIQKICVQLQIPGNLSQKITRMDPTNTKDLSDEEIAWLSDFQSLNNECPSELRQLIEGTFQTKNTQQKTTKKGK